MPTTTIHRLNDDGTHCELCQMEIPGGHRAKPGEYVGAIISTIEGVTPQFYRVGSGNEDSLCTGAPHSTFHQDSIEKHEPRQ